MKRAASHLAHHHQASVALAEQAVAQTLTNLDAPADQPIAALFLFLSEDFSPFLERVLQQTLRQTRCLNLHGCISPGLLTEKKWVMDRSAVAVLAIASDPNNSATTCNTSPAFEFLLAPAMRSHNLLWLEQNHYTGPGTLIETPIHGTAMQANIWHGGRLQAMEQIPQAIHLENFSMQYCVNQNPEASIPRTFAEQLNQLRQRGGHSAAAPDFGIMLPGLADGLLSETGLEANLAELRAQFPDTPWIGLFNPASPGHLLPTPCLTSADQKAPMQTMMSGTPYTISPDPSIVILAHHV